MLPSPPTPRDRAEHWVRNRFESVGWIQLDPNAPDRNVTIQAMELLIAELEQEFMQCEQELLEYLARTYGPPFSEANDSSDVRMIRDLMRERRA